VYYPISSLCDPGSYHNGLNCTTAQNSLTSCSSNQYFDGQSCQFFNAPLYSIKNNIDTLQTITAPKIASTNDVSIQAPITPAPTCKSGTYWYPITKTCVTQQK
jgi:hypothetical protein